MNVGYQDNKKSKQHGEEICPADEEKWKDTLLQRDGVKNNPKPYKPVG